MPSKRQSKRWAKRISSSQKRQEKPWARFRSKIDPLIAILKDENTSLAMRKQAYERLIKLAPKFKGTLDKEYKATHKLSEVYKKLTKHIENSARAKGMQELIEKQSKAASTAEFKAFEALQAKQAEDKKYAEARKHNAQVIKKEIKNGK